MTRSWMVSKVRGGRSP